MIAGYAVTAIVAALVGSFCGVTAARAALPAQTPTPGTNLVIHAPLVQPKPPAQPPAPRPLFKIGNLPVAVWTPVERPYNRHADRNFAANPPWYRHTGT